MAIGFDEKTAAIRLAQYESGARTPKADLLATPVRTLDVSPKALDLPEIDGEVCLRLDKSRGITYVGSPDMLTAWRQQAAKLEAGKSPKRNTTGGVIAIPNLTQHSSGQRFLLRS